MTKDNTDFLIKECYDIERVEPPNWWVGFKNTALQLLVKHPNISQATPEISYQGISIKQVHKADSENYLFIDLHIDPNAQAGKFNIIFKQEYKNDLIHTYELKTREKPSEEYVGFNSSDAIYLITPDRFANGDPSNDIDKDLLEKTIDRTDDYARHGGDIRGMIDHLDYIFDMGFTTVWPSPLLMNDMEVGSYHGYAITDFYKMDPRFGTLEEYKELALEISKRGMKLVMGQVANHCGIGHWWMADLPFKDWVNHQDAYQEVMKGNYDVKITSSHRRTVNQDIYASEIDFRAMKEGWFVSVMPDLNQRNNFIATYTIQNSIWWIETIKFQSIRQDTYSYPEKHFMSRWAGAIMHEYPNFSIVGEEWTNNPLLIGYWQRGAKNRDGYESNLKSPMDFAMQEKIAQAFNEDESWGNGLVKIYEGLSNDFHYTTPKDI
ncbi:cyclomaltodextrinase N-terminal domain-containing protein, partial [Algibacter sp.]|nr:cyclomaltodextrinase N-terminal domain-containing protein [Algibacter sp.]